MNQTTDSVRSQQSGLKRTVMNRRTKLIFLLSLYLWYFQEFIWQEI